MKAPEHRNRLLTALMVGVFITFVPGLFLVLQKPLPDNPFVATFFHIFGGGFVSLAVLGSARILWIVCFGRRR